MSAAPASVSAPVLADRVVLIAGAYGGLGAAAAKACARAGATLVLLGRRVPKLNRVYDAVAKEGPEPLLYPLDMEGAAPNDYADMAERIESELGRLDGLLHCAAAFRGLTPLLHADPADVARALHVNAAAPCWMTQACLPLLARAPDASVVFALDDLSRVGQAYWGGYGLAQHARTALVGMLHAELAGTSIRIAGLQPGPMRTSLRSTAYADDNDRSARDPDAYAEACVNLLSAAGAEHRGQVWRVRA